ncbi:MAG: metallophosphoesterase [Clostridia bacterium]|nr:metallophosphoesterase [Clostridia bacterium]
MKKLTVSFCVLTILCILCVSLFLPACAKDDYVPPVNTKGTLLSIGCLSDLHSKDAYFNLLTAQLKPNVKKTLKQMQGKYYDALIFGGDLTSSASPAKSHTYSIYDKILEYSDKITKNSLFVCGNHDYSAGLNKYPSSKVTTTDGYYYNYNAADFYGYIMKDRIGQLDSDDAYYEYYDNKGESGGKGNYLLGYHYQIKGFHFIGLNPHPADLLGILQRTNYTYTKGSVDWLESKLQSIGKDKTVFLIAHIPLASSVNLRTNKGIEAGMSQYMQDKLIVFPNLVWLYGHDHSDGAMLDADGNTVNISCYIKDDTAQRVTQYYDKDGNKSFVTCFMGSMSYKYGNMSNDINPKIYQGLDVDVYNDKIVLQTVNYGANSNNSGTITPFVIERNMQQ